MAGTGLTLDPEFYRRFGGAEEASSAGTGYMLAVYLAPRGQAPGIGPESGSETPPTDGIARYDSPHGSVRYVLYKDSRALAALQVVTRDGKHAQIANAYVEPRWRRHGFATELLDRARADFASVVHSKDMSPDAKKWKARVGEAASFRVGDRVFFEYHCEQSETSCDAKLWHHTRQYAKVERVIVPPEIDEEVAPMYELLFDDGFTGQAMDDEVTRRPPRNAAKRGVIMPPGRAMEGRKTALTPADCSHIQQWLFDYLSTDVDPYDFGWMVMDWAVENGVVDGFRDAPTMFEELEPEQQEAFTKWLKGPKGQRAIQHARNEAPQDLPAYVMLHTNANPSAKMAPGSWFVHFTNASFTKFTQGTTLEGLQLSTWKSRKDLVNCSTNLAKDQGLYDTVFGFAVAVEDIGSRGEARSYAKKYGKHALLFQCDCAVNAFHDGDNEYQSIFPLCSEYNVHEVSGIDEGGVLWVTIDGEDRNFATLQQIVEALETKPKRRGTRGAEEAGGIIPVDHRAVEEAAKRVASQFAHHLLSADLDGKPLVWMFDHADNKMKVRDQLVTNGPPEVEFGYFTPFKFGTMKTVRGHDLIDKIMIHPVLVWREDSKDLILGAATRGVAFTGYASIWVRVNVASPYAKDLRDHPGNFTRQFSSVLLHEVTHIRDYIRQQDIVDPEKYRDKPGAGYDAFVKYVNSPHELRAYSSQIVYEVLNVLQHGGYISKKLRERAELRRDNPNEWLIEQALERSHTWNQKQGAMYPESRARVLRAVYRALEREGLLVVQGAPRLPRTMKTAAEAHHAAHREIMSAEPEGLVVRNEVFDMHGGETFGAVSAWLDGLRVGNMPWSEWHGVTGIKMIDVAPGHRRQGIATAMYRKLREEAPGEIDWGGMTVEGRQLYRHLKHQRAL